MTVDTEILQTITQMPEPLKQEVLHYAKYLIENYSKVNSEEKTPQKKRRSGILKGTFVLPLPDDFDEPLELTNAAARTGYEKKYGYGSLAGKIVISDDFDEPLEDLKDYM
ncbi:MAG: DUF2281 domain-containing protein [Elainellaceae cyanobacterium]